MEDITEQRDGDDQADRQFVTSLSRGLSVLGCFTGDDRYLSNLEISNRTGLARPTVSRLTYTLTKTGHLHRDDASGEYRLAAKVLEIGFGALAAVNVIERSSETMDRICGGPNPYITVALAERSGNRAVYLATSRSRQAVSLTMAVGSRLPLFYSGIGRAILVGESEENRQKILREGIAEFPEQKHRMEQSIEEALRDYTTYGYCTSFGAWKAEINSIAAPVRSLDGTSIYGLNIGGPSFLVSPQVLHGSYGVTLLEAAAELGGRS
ncbi:IclR family transcriptional regulator [Nitratireductor sp. XY-223]|uniref:IclR family transcriptional regulator n=1 Tax=Nitratireductor sp. XY-223 TaxID=2561926 RepID=UPI00145B06CF|nr:IclR family transcriptional regulator [Nitratireductor sp. XY-223]